MARNGINSLILQNRLVSQARSRARTQSTKMGSILRGSSDSNSNSLANAIKKQARSQKNGLLGTASTKSKENYTSMKTAAESLKTRTKTLLNMPEKEWEKLTEEEVAEYKGDMLTQVSGLIEDYNKIMKAMTEEGGSVNEIYAKQMKGYFQSAKSKLGELGITQNSDGTLSLNKELFKSADASKMKEVLGKAGTFIDDIGKRAENILANAETNLAVLNRSQYAGNYSYNQYGSDIFDALLGGGKYNAKG
ncbi:MAG: hypothetical protein K2H52_07230 [Lachnospiraceae bacterium]|nr:hypothetical protein [Lachnospiraceae bacterium]MDE6185899.1 hypothetical protein [Lachnospiraceae bacterium]MDE7286325.1 hypothetical protein [Lachnospiraceae bacterium]